VRVAFFTESLPPLTDGVARTYTWLAQALDEAGVDFRFYSPCEPTESEPWRGRVEAQPWFSFPLYRYYRVGLALPWRLFRQLDAFKPDIVQAAAPTPLGWLAWAYAKRRGLPFVTSYHTHFTDYFPYYGLGFLQRPGWAVLRAFHNAGQMTLAPSPSCVARLQGEGLERLVLWERGLDASRFHPRFRSAEERARWAPPDHALLLFAGRLVADKDLELLATALESLRARGRKLTCVFAGDGPLREALSRRLPEDRFPGFVHGLALAKLYASADIFTFPSPNETFGNVVLEAMASGLPVLAVDQGGPRDLIQHGASGWLSPARDAAAFAAAIERLCDEPGTRETLARGGVERARGFHWKEVHGRLIGRYQGLLEGSVEQAELSSGSRRASAADAKRG
jgi:glycosyltransferase involved in cell wall biosynthesis